MVYFIWILTNVYYDCAIVVGFPGGSVVMNLPASARRCNRHGFNPWVWKITLRRKWQPTPVFFPEESYGQRSLVDATVHRVTKSQIQLSHWACTLVHHCDTFRIYSFPWTSVLCIFTLLPLITPGNHRLFSYLHSFVFSRMSCRVDLWTTFGR